MRIGRLRLPGAVALILIATFARSAIEDTTFVIDPIVVTSTRVETARRNVPGSITVVTRAELVATGATGVLDAVAATTPGVFVTQRGVAGFGLGSGAAGKITIRGLGGEPNSEVLVLVDGRPDYTGLFGHPLPDAYALNEVDRVEIIRGPASAIYGTNAMGGVINIITRQQRSKGSLLTFGGMAGPWNTWDANTTFLGARNTDAKTMIDWRLALGHTRTNGHRENADFRRTHASGAFGVVRKPWDVRLQASATPFEGHDPGAIGAARADRWIDVIRNSASAKLTYASEPIAGRFLLHRNWGTHDFYDGWHSTDHVEGITSYLGWHRSNGPTATVAFDIRQYGGMARNDTTRVRYGTHEVVEYAPYATIQIPVGEIASFTASARAQHHTTYDWLFAPEAGGTFTPIPSMTLRASASRGFRSPDIRALYLFTVPVSADSLKPERVTNIEGGITWRAASWLVVEASVFRITGDDIIGVRPPPPPPAVFTNSGSFESRGLEMELRWAFPHVHGRLFTAVQDAGDTPGSAERTIAISATTTMRQVRIMTAIERIDGLRGTGTELRGYTLANATFTMPIVRYVEAQLMLRNMLDEDYQTITGYTMPGFHALVGLSASVGK